MMYITLKFISKIFGSKGVIFSKFDSADADTEFGFATGFDLTIHVLFHQLFLSLSSPHHVCVDHSYILKPSYFSSAGSHDCIDQQQGDTA